MLFDLAVDGLHRLAPESVDLRSHLVHAFFESGEKVVGHATGLDFALLIGAAGFESAIAVGGHLKPAT